MDANGTRYHLLLGLEDWGACLDPSGAPLRELWARDARAAKKSKQLVPRVESLVAWDRQRAELTLQPRLFKFVAAAGDARPDISNRRGAARDRYGNWYWIDETSRKIRVNSAGTRRTTDFWPPPAGVDACDGDETDDAVFRPRETKECDAAKLGGLAVTVDHYLVAGTVEPRGILIFDLHAGGAPRRMLWPAGVEFEPFDIAARPEGGVLILDRANKRYWELDRTFAVVVHLGKGETDEAPAAAEDFAPLGGEAAETNEAACARPAQITAQAAVRLFLHDVLAIDALPDGSALILANRRKQNFARVHRFREGRRVGRSVSTRSMLELVEPERRAEFNTYGYDFAFVAGREAGDGTTAPDRVYVVASDGNQAYSFQIDWRGQKQIVLHPEATFLPMRLFGGKALVAAGDKAYYDFEERFIPLVEQRRPRYVTEATLLTPAAPGEDEPPRVFDGRDPGCVWHRLMLDACLPPGTGVEVWSRTADELADLASAAWQPEPPPHLRAEGSELPFVGPLNRRSAEVLRAQREGSGTWELLFQRAHGRFLQLRLRLAGDGRSTPRLRALRAYFPRFSYPANYLPAVYREDDLSASFLERYLANPEGFFTALEDRIAAVQALFDVRSAPSDALDWLADWFGVALDPAWDEPRRRLFIKHAMHFFQYRGTRHGLELALRLVFDECIDDSAFTVEPCCAPDKSSGKNAADAASTTSLTSVTNAHKATSANGSMIGSQGSAVSARGIRIVEQFRSRRAPAASSRAPAATGGPAVIETGAAVRWTPADRGVRLHELYRERLNLAAGAEYPVRDPGGARSAAWREFSRGVLGFVPDAASADRDAWQEFLARRYANVKNLNAAYQTTRNSFADVPLPASLPPDGAALSDWYEFESVVVATRRAAHRFTVLLPVPGTETFDTEAQRARRDLTRRVVELEKPAHTVFDIKFYWAMFRVGFARLGDDTIVDLGGRAPALMPPMALGQEHLAESYLAAQHPQSVREGRRVVGRGDVVKCRPA